MTRVNSEQQKLTPWFAKAGAACSIVPISRFVNDRIFALKGGGYLAGQALGSSRMSQLAMVETSDAISPDCLTAVGQYRTNRSENSTANSSLLSDQFDSGDGTNSEVQQLNLLNASEAQKLSEMQAQGTLQSCLAGQMTVANMERRNAAVEDINTAAFVQQQRSTNNVTAASESNTWQTYLP
jgi:hypothetical protein